jgi:hypothetical protein
VPVSHNLGIALSLQLKTEKLFKQANKVVTKKNPTRCIKMLLFLILYEAQHVSDDTPPIIRSLKLHKQPLVLHSILEGCRTCSYLTTSNNCMSDNLPRYYAKPEAACAVLGS